jgi:hypothetical protein
MRRIDQAFGLFESGEVTADLGDDIAAVCSKILKHELLPILDYTSWDTNSYRISRYIRGYYCIRANDRTVSDMTIHQYLCASSYPHIIADYDLTNLSSLIAYDLPGLDSVIRIDNLNIGSHQNVVADTDQVLSSNHTMPPNYRIVADIHFRGRHGELEERVILNGAIVSDFQYRIAGQPEFRIVLDDYSLTGLGQIPPRLVCRH